MFGVIGLGRFGSALARTLAEAGKEVIAVDCDEQKVKAIRKYTDYAFVVDDLSEEALTEVGIQNCGTVGICIGELAGRTDREDGQLDVETDFGGTVQVGPAGHDRHGAHFIQPLDLPCGARLGGLGSPR